MRKDRTDKPADSGIFLPVLLTVLVFACAALAWTGVLNELAGRLFPLAWQRWIPPVFFGLIAITVSLAGLFRYRRFAAIQSIRKSDQESDSEIGRQAWNSLPGNHFWLWNWQTGTFCFAGDWLDLFDYKTMESVRSQMAGQLGQQPQLGARPLALWELLVHPDDAESALRGLLAYQAEAGGDTTLVQQYRIRTGAGSYRWIETATRSVRNQAGLVLGLSAVFQDITNQVETREQLVQEKSFTEGLMNSTDLFVLVLDTAGRIKRFNPFASRITGYTEAEVAGRSWIDCLFRESDKPDMRPPVRAGEDQSGCSSEKGQHFAQRRARAGDRLALSPTDQP